MPRYQACADAAGGSREVILECDGLPGLHGFLRAQTHGHGPSPIFTGSRDRRFRPDGGRDRGDLMGQFEYLAARRIYRNILNLFAIEMLERKRGMERSIQGATPSGGERAARARDLYHLVVLK